MVTDQTYPSNLMITAEVQVNSWNAGDVARAGVGLYTDPSDGNGYNLVFHGTNQVQFLDDKVTWGNAYTFNWQVGTWYWFQLAEINGTLEGKVWAAGTAEPQSWMFQQTGWTDLTGGTRALDGGSADASAGSSTVSFASVSVTTTGADPTTLSPTSLAPPPGYTASQMIFDDKFLNPTLDSTKWIPQIADEWGIWHKSVPAPYSAINAGGYQINYDDPYPQQGTNTTGLHVVTGNGLRIIATPSNRFPGYTWASGAVTTHGLFSFSGGYVQIRGEDARFEFGDVGVPLVSGGRVGNRPSRVRQYLGVGKPE